MNRKRLTTVTLAALAGGVFAGSAHAASAVDVINDFATADDKPTIFQDTTFNFDPISLLDVVSGAEEITAYFSIEQIGDGLSSPTLDGGLTNAPSPAIFLGAADVPGVIATVTVQGLVRGSVIGTAGLDGVGTATLFVGPTGALSAANYLGEVWISDDYIDPTTADFSTRTSPIPTFTQDSLAAGLFLDGVDDFFTLTVDEDNAEIIGFEAGLSIVNFLLPEVVESPLSTGQNVDLYATGGNFADSGPGAFITGDADIAINLVPTPIAAGPALLGLGLVALRRKRAEA